VASSQYNHLQYYNKLKVQNPHVERKVKEPSFVKNPFSASQQHFKGSSFASKVQPAQFLEETADSDKIHLPRTYAWVNVVERPASHSNVEEFKISWNSSDAYRVI